jgi:hypothetical protein
MVRIDHSEQLGRGCGLSDQIVLERERRSCGP